MRRLALTYAGAVVFFGLLIVAATGVGALVYVPPPLMADVQDCQLQCWNGITLGQSRADAHTRLIEDGFRFQGQNVQGTYFAYFTSQPRCWVDMTLTSDAVTRLQMIGCGGITLGDLMLLLGRPDHLITGDGATIRLTWRDEQISAIMTDWISPFARIVTINLNAPDSADSPEGRRRDWHGFVSPRLYCRLEHLTRFYNAC